MKNTAYAFQKFHNPNEKCTEVFYKNIVLYISHLFWGELKTLDNFLLKMHMLVLHQISPVNS